MARAGSARPGRTTDSTASQVLGGLSSEGSTSYSRTVSQLTAEREANPNKANPTPSDMVLSLLLQINEAPSVKGKSGNELDEALTAQLKEHREKLAARTLQASAQLKGYEEEEKRKITSDGIREGWSSGVSGSLRDGTLSADTRAAREQGRARRGAGPGEAEEQGQGQGDDYDHRDAQLAQRAADIARLGRRRLGRRVCAGADTGNVQVH